MDEDFSAANPILDKPLILPDPIPVGMIEAFRLQGLVSRILWALAMADVHEDYLSDSDEDLVMDWGVNSEEGKATTDETHAEESRRVAGKDEAALLRNLLNVF
ncbi:hypothetical protein HK101_009445 [Irineochytrium annulatum]|nr:hypothetical protein HK101_009445 [Irineochytrium annulatum]